MFPKTLEGTSGLCWVRGKCGRGRESLCVFWAGGQVVGME